MGRSDTFEGIDNHRRRFFGAAALAIAAAQLRLIGPANAQVGKAKRLPPDGLFPIYHLTEAMMRDRLPGPRGYVGLDGVGHWVQHEAAAQVNQDLITFARAVNA